MDHGFDPNTGHFSTWVHPDLSHLDTNHGLYDLAFSLLAATALGAAGRDVAADLNRIDQAFGLLRAPKGWYEDAAHSLPRCQNPHMHMFEASTAAYALTKASKYLGMAQECLEIIVQSALQKDGQLLEFFTKDWVPLTGVEQAIEPGHMAEWIYLADTFTNVTGFAHGLPLKQMWQAVLEHRLPSGFLPDQAGGQVRRMWPQTELLKAAVVMKKIDPQLTLTARPEDIAQTLWADYMNTPIAGGWYDRFEETGALLSTNMPASTYYHIDVAISTCEASSIIRE
jgi:mannose-6-phosphate isomerase